MGIVFARTVHKATTEGKRAMHRNPIKWMKRGGNESKEPMPIYRTARTIVFAHTSGLLGTRLGAEVGGLEVAIAAETLA